MGSVTVHVLQTGWVRVKEAHRTLSGPQATRLLSIALGRRWTELMPVLVGVVEHPDGVFIVDAGLTEDTLDPEHFACDAGTRFFYENFLEFRFDPAARVDRRLEALGIPPERVAGVVLTHRHADHADGLAHLPRGAPVYVGAGDWPTHTGALSCRWPDGRTLVTVPADGAPLGAFPASRPLTADGRVVIVPLVGHSPGHLGVLVRGEAHDILFGGDAAFDVGQIARGQLAGIVDAPDDAARTLGVLAAQLRARPTMLVLAHELSGLARFLRGDLTKLP